MAVSRKSLVVCCIVVMLATQVSGWIYLPGVMPKDYEDLDPVLLKVNSLTSDKRQIPFDYYSKKLKFCQPVEIKKEYENLGEILSGDLIETSAYELKMNQPETCKVLCQLETSPAELKQFYNMINQEYKVNWLVDNLPAHSYQMNQQPSELPSAGFFLGKASTSSLFNHHEIVISYHVPSKETKKKRVVGFLVTPYSIDYGENFDGSNKYAQDCTANNSPLKLEKDPKATRNITWTYSVSWRKNDELRWASRWDTYLKMDDPQIHWFSIINSLMIVLFLTGMVAMIMMRTLHADFQRYREMETQEELQEETGWKLVHGDVFRPPSNPMFLAVLVGNGVQVIALSSITLFFALLGFLSPANRGGLLTALVVFYLLMSIFAGYFSARVYKALKGTNWKRCTVATTFLLSGCWFLIFFVLNCVLWWENSVWVHFGWLSLIILMWFGLSVPLTFAGSYLGYKKPLSLSVCWFCTLFIIVVEFVRVLVLHSDSLRQAPENPVRTNQIPRQIPETVWYMKPIVSILMGGILPFGAIFIELFFILSSIWRHQFYYMLGFLFIVFIILIVTCAEITVVMCYFQLCSEDYHWWWRSFLTAGASAFYMFCYFIFFYTEQQFEGMAPTFLYFGYSFIMASAFFCMTGAVGFYACYAFVRKIYSVVKVD